jgi:hypothetical protein
MRPGEPAIRLGRQTTRSLPGAFGVRLHDSCKRGHDRRVELAAGAGEDVAERTGGTPRFGDGDDPRLDADRRPGETRREPAAVEALVVLRDDRGQIARLGERRKQLGADPDVVPLGPPLQGGRRTALREISGGMPILPMSRSRAAVRQRRRSVMVTPSS